VLKEEKSKDPYSHVRRINPPPNFVFINKKAYNRQEAKLEEGEIIQEAIEDLEGLDE